MTNILVMVGVCCFLSDRCRAGVIVLNTNKSPVDLVFVLYDKVITTQRHLNTQLIHCTQACCGYFDISTFESHCICIHILKL